MSRSGGRILVDQLELNGVDVAFCVPGESYLAVLDALHDSPIRLVSARHEAGAANMAEAYGKLTGRPGICLVTRGPGATHASVGVHTAWQDSTPLILLVGQVPRDLRGRDAFQELDYRAVFGSTAKHVEEVESAQRMPEAMARAFSAALSGRPGPVVVSLPEDVLGEESDAGDAAPVEAPQPRPSAEELARVGELLAGAERPLVVVGEGGWDSSAARDALAFCEASRIPVTTSFRCQDFVDNHSPVYAGPLTIGMSAALAERVGQVDVLLAIGSRLGDIQTRGYTLLEPPRPLQTLIHVHPDPDELGRVYEPALGVVSALPAFCAALEPIDGSRWTEWTSAAHEHYLANLRHKPMPGDVDMGEVMAHLRERLPPDAIMTCGAGNFTVWAHRFYEFSQFGTQLAPRSGAMGYGVPAAIAAKVLHPERDVVCLSGDGDFMMSAGELATAVQYELGVVILVVNNGMYGTIRMHQERHYPGRVVGTDLVNPDFAELARSFGAHGAVVERTAEFPDALEQALSTGGRPALVELRVDPEAITPNVSLSEIRRLAQQAPEAT